MSGNHKKSIVIWGTGNVATYYIGNRNCISPDFYLDNDSRKSGMEFMGKYVCHPDDISNWEDYFCIIAIDNYEMVKNQLCSYGLEQYKDFVWYREYHFDMTFHLVQNEADAFYNNIDSLASDKQNKRLFFSDCLNFDKGVISYLSKRNASNDYVLMSETVKMLPASNIQGIDVIELPSILAYKFYLFNEEYDIIPNTPPNLFEQYLVEAAKNLRLGFPRMADGYENWICYYADFIIRKILKEWNPKEVILWNEFYALHKVIAYVCKEFDIPVSYMEFGNIPGTIIKERYGQLGKSWPALYSDGFKEIPVLDTDLNIADRWLTKLYSERTNRNNQPHNNNIELIRERVKYHPIILYAGQNDNASGMQPYTSESEKYHSPIFHDSNACARYLCSLCNLNKWQLVYKPHPMASNITDQVLLDDDSLIICDNVDINDIIDECDVLVTIVSTVSYIGLIRKKPVVMLGYTQLKNSGATYEAFSIDTIGEELSKAVNHVDLEMHQRKFVEQIVRESKYYQLFPDI